MQTAVANEFVFNCQLIFCSFTFHCYHFHINYSLKGFSETFSEHPFVKKYFLGEHALRWLCAKVHKFVYDRKYRLLRLMGCPHQWMCGCITHFKLVYSHSGQSQPQPNLVCVIVFPEMHFSLHNILTVNKSTSSWMMNCSKVFIYSPTPTPIVC